MATMADIEAMADGHGIDLSQVDLDSIELPPGDDFGIKRSFLSFPPAHLLFHLVVPTGPCCSCVICSDDESDLPEEDAHDFDDSFGSVIVVDNLPVVPPEKFDKLESVVRKIYNQIGVIKEDGFWMPLNPETKKTLGYCFIEFSTSQV